ncbi:MAG: elongation factor Ts [Chloroflexi bacterium]|nr:elongation factor Ts [Chloroflexota bacterium]
MEITTEMVKELRQRTGAGILDSKKALQDTQGDMQRAIDLLREKGLARAAKKAEREAKDGVIEARVGADGKRGVLVEVNCETDFVARTDAFRALAADLAGQVFDANPPYATAADMPNVEQIKSAIAQLGENIQVRRIARYDVGEGASALEVYVHAGGRVAVLVELSAQTSEKAQSAAFKALAHDIALQIAAIKPVYVRPEDVPAGVIESERAIYRAQLAEEKKPANVIERIIDGKLQKFYEDACLLNQPFIRDDKVKIAALIKQASGQLGEAVQVKRFVRFELGD